MDRIIQQVAFHLYYPPHSTMFSRFNQFVVMCQHVSPFCGWIMFHCMDVPHSVYPVIMVGSVGNRPIFLLRQNQPTVARWAHYFYTFQIFKNFRKCTHFGIFPELAPRTTTSLFLGCGKAEGFCCSPQLSSLYFQSQGIQFIFIPFQPYREPSSFGSKADEMLLLPAWLYLGPCSGWQDPHSPTEPREGLRVEPLCPNVPKVTLSSLSPPRQSLNKPETIKW